MVIIAYFTGLATKSEWPHMLVQLIRNKLVCNHVLSENSVTMVFQAVVWTTIILLITFTQKGDCLDTNVGEDDEGQPFTITDSQGNGCNVYTSDDVTRCGHYDDEDFKATSMCCGCKGNILICFRWIARLPFHIPYQIVLKNLNYISYIL